MIQKENRRENKEGMQTNFTEEVFKGATEDELALESRRVELDGLASV